MNATDTSFDGVSVAFFEYEQSVRGAIRYELVRENLLPLLQQPQSILDIGGGSGPDTAWLASKGHNVTLVEPSGEQLAIAAEHRFIALDPSVRKHITVIQGTIESLPATLHESFDIVLSHGVAMYLDNADAYWQSCLTFLKPQGHISVLEKGFAGCAIRLASQNRFADLELLLQTKKLAQNNMGRSIQTYEFADIRKSLETTGANVIDHAGIRTFTDVMYEPKSQIPDEEWSMLLNRERLCSRAADTMRTGQMLHVIAQKL